MAGNAQLIDPVWERDIVAYSGNPVVVTFRFLNEDKDTITLTGYSSAVGSVYDEDGTVVLDLAPNLNMDPGEFALNVEVDDTVPPGRYDWTGSLVDTGGDEHVRLRGTFNILER